MISVLVIDSDPLFYQLLKKILSNPEMTFIGHAQTGSKAFDLLRKNKVSNSLVVLVSCHLSDMLGESICRYIHRHWPHVLTIFLMNSVHWPTLSRLIETPAKGFISKNSSYYALEAIKMVHAGKTYLQPDLALKLIRYRERPSIPLLETLSAREYEVLMLLAKNKTYDEIISLIPISLKTAYNLKVSACKKLGIADPLDISDQLFPDGGFKIEI